MVSLVLVAHSDRLLSALVELVTATTTSPPACATAGGTEDGRMGTSLARIRAALRTGLVTTDDGCVVLYDTGSAWLTIGIALDELSPIERGRVTVSDGPLVVGTLAAAARAADGASLQEVAAASASALDRDKRPPDEPATARDEGTRLTA